MPLLLPINRTTSIRYAACTVAFLIFLQATCAHAFLWQADSKPTEDQSPTVAVAPEGGDGNKNIESELARGKSIYASSCSDCHGDSAQGVEGVFDSPLEGDLPVVELAKYVSDTMPEGEPDLCTGEEARLVSQYLHHAFYSRTAQLRNNPPEIAFSRRTVQQYQNSVADIMRQLKWQGDPDDKRGLNAKYYETRELHKGGAKVEKVEQFIDFDYGEKTPYPEKLKDDTQFSVEWFGGLIAKETGVYEFIATSPNGFRLSVNEEEYTIDNNVNSTDQSEFKASMKLAGGQAYPFSVTMFKFNEKKAGMKLEWIPPGGVREVIPESALSPSYYSAALVFNTEFPADDSSVGYARGTAISQQWDTATTQAAIEAMNFVETHLELMMNETVGELKRRKRRKRRKKDKDYKKDGGKKEDKAEEEPPEMTDQQEDDLILKRHRDFATKFVAIALGREPSAEEQAAFVNAQFESASSPLVALKRTILLTLKSPQFLYLTQSTDKRAAPLSGPERQNAVAATLANVMWDSIPDKSLREAAQKNELSDHQSITDRAWGMLDRPRTHQKLSDFFFHWLEMEKTEHASKDEEIYPGFDQELIYSLRNSIEQSLDDIIWSDTSDYRQLFLFDKIYVNDRISNFYGIESDTGGEFVKTNFESDRRCGILTHPYLMTGLSYYKNTSPIHRGVFVAKSLLGRSLKAPPVDVDPLDEAFDPSMTTRERVTHQTKEVNCKGCHSVINPLGFSLENFDAVGRFRDKEKDKPINSKTIYVTPEATEVPFSGAKDLANFLVDSPDAHRNFIEQLFRHFVKQPVHAFGSDTLDNLYRDFVQSDYNVKQLIVSIAVVAASKS